MGILGQKEHLMRKEASAVSDEFSDQEFGSPKLISHDLLLNESNGFIVDGSVTFFCDVSC